MKKKLITILTLTIITFGCQNENKKMESKTDKAVGLVNISAIHHYALSVKDIKQTSEWYREMFGFEIERQFGFKELGVEIAHLIHPSGIRIELLHSTIQKTSPDLNMDAFGAINTLGSKHIGLQVDDINKVNSDLKNKGVKFLHELTKVEIAGVTNLWILDNEGNQIEIVEPLK
jgi:catechol 2,3-dioxygenase-like lactoylglutathione lyase family enzyme